MAAEHQVADVTNLARTTVSPRGSIIGMPRHRTTPVQSDGPIATRGPAVLVLPNAEDRPSQSTVFTGGVLTVAWPAR